MSYYSIKKAAHQHLHTRHLQFLRLAVFAGHNILHLSDLRTTKDIKNNINTHAFRSDQFKHSRNKNVINEHEAETPYRR